MQETLRDVGSIPGSGRSPGEGKSQGQRSLAGYSPQGCKESDTTLPRSHVQMWEVNHKEGWGLKNCCFWIVVLEKIPESPLDYKEIKPVNPNGDQSWIFSGRTDAEANTLAMWFKEPAQWKRLCCWERLRVGGERDDRGWDGWMALPPQWTWVWVSSGSSWWTGRPGVPQSMG